MIACDCPSQTRYGRAATRIRACFFVLLWCPLRFRNWPSQAKVRQSIHPTTNTQGGEVSEECKRTMRTSKLCDRSRQSPYGCRHRFLGKNSSEFISNTDFAILFCLNAVLVALFKPLSVLKFKLAPRDKQRELQFFFDVSEQMTCRTRTKHLPNADWLNLCWQRRCSRCSIVMSL